MFLTPLMRIPVYLSVTVIYVRMVAIVNDPSLDLVNIFLRWCIFFLKFFLNKCQEIQENLGF